METETIQRVQKMTSKGQITLPSKWRARVGTQHVIVRAQGTKLTIAPARFEFEDDDEDRADDEIIFSAKRDNKGKGIPIDEFVRILEKHEKEDEKVRKIAAKTKRKK